jgi:hypothetical protein
MSRPRGVRTPTSVPLTGRSASDLLLARDHHCEHGQERADHDHTGKAGEVTTPGAAAILLSSRDCRASPGLYYSFSSQSSCGSGTPTERP